MPLTPGCPRCPTPVADAGPELGWSCPDHGSIRPLWRPDEVSYDAFAEHLRASPTFPTYLPWPLSPGWSVSDFALVGDGAERAVASLAVTAGTSDLDGPVEVAVVAEEAGVGLGARVAGLTHGDPGPELGAGAPAVKVRVDGQVVPLWPVSATAPGGELDRSVVVGEAHGRWLWIVLRPASAVLLLQGDWLLRDVTALGPPLVELPFGGPAPLW
ncbi:MAG: DUF6758 family protein [Nocardioides sp.]